MVIFDIIKMISWRKRPIFDVGERMSGILKSENYQTKLKKVRTFLLSNEWMAFLFCLGALFTTLNEVFPGRQIEIYGTLVFGFIVAGCLVISDDIMAGLAPFMLTCLVAIKCYDSFDAFMRFKLLAIPLAVLLGIHFIAYRKKLVIGGTLFWPMVFVSISILLGGLGFISSEEYFAPTSLYHMVGLGFGMVFLYIYFYSHIEVHSDYSLIGMLTKIMVLSGCFASFMVITYYIININTVIDVRGLIYLQWRNNLSTILMLTMPFAFFRASKKSYAVVLGFIFYFAILLTGSRGGLVFGSVELLMCIVMYMVYDRRRRLAYIIICGFFLFAFLAFSRQFIDFFGSTLDRLFKAINDFLIGEENEVRAIHYKRGINDFLNNPIFGTGLGYMGNRDVHASKEGALCWYHCEPIQIAASFGMIGLAAFAYQFIRRNVLLWRKATLFNMTVFLSYMSLEMMSLVNPGILCPMPYLLLVTMFFVIVEKCDVGEKQEKIHFKSAKHKKKKENT